MPGTYLTMSSICCRPRMEMALESKALMDSETSCSRSARRVAVTMTSPSAVACGGGASCAAAAPLAVASTADTAADNAREPERPIREVSCVMSASPRQPVDINTGPAHRRHIPFQEPLGEILHRRHRARLIEARIHARLVALDDGLVRKGRD